MLGDLRGIYAKLGQHLAMRADLLPDEIRTELSVLEDSARAIPFPRVRRALRRSLGPVGLRFSYIDPEPLGTASIAQVHRARLVGGGVVAVKVRHPELDRARLDADVRTLRRTGRRLRRWLGGVDVDATVVALSEALRDELDFRREGRIAEEIAARFADDPRVVVPRVHWNATREDVLTMDYVPCVRLDDRRRLSEAGVEPARCVEIVADAYGRQIFGLGLFHADPHPGNVFLVDESSGLRPEGGPGPRILFVDFGLSQRLPEQLREELRLGLHALLRRDIAGIRAGLERIDAVQPGRTDEAEAALRDALEGGAASALGAGTESIESLVQLGKRLVRESGAFRVPPELLLYARTLSMIFSLAHRIAPEANPMKQLLPHLMKFLS